MYLLSLVVIIMPDQQILLLYARKLAGEATSEELTELEDYLKAHPDEQYIQGFLQQWWESTPEKSVKATQDQDERFNQLWLKTQSETRHEQEVKIYPTPVFPLKKNWPLRKWVAAAAITGIVFFAYRLLFNQSAVQVSTAENEIVAQKGTRSKLLLPDGTQVWLNADSKLNYSNAFNDTLREVVLEGEAYFDVVKDPRRPFIVHTSGINIRVLGTAFTVRSYPQDPTIEATLFRGAIEVEKRNHPQSSRIQLKPNEKLVYNKSAENSYTLNQSDFNKETAVTPVAKPESITISRIPVLNADSNRAETSWMYGKLIFEGENFTQLAPKMERWFNIKMHVNDDRVATFRFTGVFTDENIGDALHALQLTAPFSYTIKENEIWIDKK